jgi:hypothetical protein
LNTTSILKKIQDGDSIKNTDIKIQLIVVSERMSNLNKEKKMWSRMESATGETANHRRRM